MTSPAPELVHVKRAMTAKEATQLVGRKVDDLRPTVQRETIAFDADSGEPVFAYLNLGPAGEHLRETVLDFTVTEVGRASGNDNRGRTFGYSPRRPVYRREACSQTSLMAEAPAGHVQLEQWANILRGKLADIDPKLVENGDRATDVVLPEWKLGDSYWTSGVINLSARLPYHRDGFNFKAWSAMPVFRRHMRGGYLSIPEYDTVIPCRDGWAAFFPGWELVHGVTPMKATHADGYRYSIVYYALSGMKDCFTAAKETEYALRRRTEREQKMAAELKAGEAPLRSVALSKKQSGRLIGGLDAPRFDSNTGVRQ
ncbi:hypothetical protein [Prescottella equi]|uniref:hypothetical protein n=1 Tax=Rhodococcus hoagii TaxID=43767 RepID=UPI0015854EE1|nr:hypothetical protein [Prescottella equi]